jgi:DNA-binding MarR family transcriptional regulator
MENEKRSDARCNEKLAPTPPMLINEVSRMFFRIVKQKDGDGDKRPTREQHSARLMLMHLSRCESATQSELVRVTRMKAPTISVALKNMENEGLVTRVADDKDQRITHVYITEKGRRVDGENLSRLRDVAAVMMDGITEDEAAAMMATLFKMRENLARELNNSNETD